MPPVSLLGCCPYLIDDGIDAITADKFFNQVIFLIDPLDNGNWLEGPIKFQDIVMVRALCFFSSQL